MAQLKIPCPSCQAVTAIDEAKLPDKAVSFSCPHCKAKVTVDKTKLIGAAGLHPEAGAAAAAPAPHEVPQAVPSDDLPPGVTLPSGIILGEDPATIAYIRSSLERYGCTLQPTADPEEARAQILLDPPHLVIYVANAVGAPPYEPLQPVTAVPPADRRKFYLMLVGDGVRTLDGNAAFMYQVNLCLNKADLATVAGTLYSGIEYHRRLYRSYFAAAQAV